MSDAARLVDEAARELDDDHLDAVAQLLVAAGVYSNDADAYEHAMNVLAASYLVASTEPAEA